MNAFDLVVIGTGTAARVAATRVRRAGRSVAVADNKPFGGTCALRGCDPKKMLVSGAEAVDWVHRLRGHGVSGKAKIDWAELQRFKRSFTDPIPDKQEKSYASEGIASIHGTVRFIGPTELMVGGALLRATHILIATGAEPVQLGFPGEQHLATSDDFLTLEALPERIVFVGGGYIAAEFANIAARAGSTVTILQRAERLLTGFDPDLVGWLTVGMTRLGIDIRTRTSVTAIGPKSSGVTVRTTASVGPGELEADLVVHAAGRRPALAALDLEVAGVAVENGRPRLNSFLQSVSNSAVYVAGDAAQVGPPLTPVSSHDGKIVATNILDGNCLTPNYAGVPSVAFTIPPIASVGLSEAEARRSGRDVDVHCERTSGWYTARRVAEAVYGFKTIVAKDNGEILGAHLVGPDVDETINIFALAIRHRLTRDDLKATMFAYPTGASDIGSML